MRNVPELITVNTGDQVEVSKTIDDFFIETKDFIVSNILSEYGGNQNDFRLESGEIAFQPNVVTDNRITYLLYKQRVVACVLETRTEFNYVHYDFFRNLDDLNRDQHQK